jgi:NAD(P)-dependent dehydrogenase (short-subunit alcohol dehydrogenase family)
MDYEAYFGLQAEVAVVTGGGGVLGRTLAATLAQAGAQVAVLNRRPLQPEAAAFFKAAGVTVLDVPCDVTDAGALAEAVQRVEAALGAVTILVNAAGGNQPGATTGPERNFFELDPAAIEQVFALNFQGTLLACQAFGKAMAARGRGSIINIASMAAVRPLTRVVSYSAAKAALVNFTQWLAVHFAREYNPALRVNALAPGFFLTEQNRFLLTERETGKLTARGQAIVDHTPAGRFGDPQELAAALLWLAGAGAKFVTGAVIPVDGGFSAFSGV